jgi:phage terminase large subunit-like protein
MVADVGRSGAMVESMMKLVDPRVRVLKKGGNKGKRAWAESVAVLYSKHLIFNARGSGSSRTSAASGPTT